MARRDPAMLTAYVCSFCAQQIRWGEIVRVLQREHGQPDYLERESYAHRACLRAALHERVPLAFARQWSPTHQWPDDAAELRDQPCGLCETAIKPHEKIKLCVQIPIGTFKKPDFMEESLQVHRKCWDAAKGV